MEKITSKVIQTKFRTTHLNGIVEAEILEENGAKTVIIKTETESLTFGSAHDFEELSKLFYNLYLELSGKNDVVAVTPRQRAPRSDAGKPRFPRGEVKVTPIQG